MEDVSHFLWVTYMGCTAACLPACHILYIASLEGDCLPYACIYIYMLEHLWEGPQSLTHALHALLHYLSGR